MTQSRSDRRLPPPSPDRFSLEERCLLALRPRGPLNGGQRSVFSEVRSALDKLVLRGLVRKDLVIDRECGHAVSPRIVYALTDAGVGVAEQLWELDAFEDQPVEAP